MVDPRLRTIFRRGSRTYFNSTRFFPRRVRDDVFRLYGFVRSADTFVDSMPQKRDEFYAFYEGYRREMAGQSSGDAVLRGFCEVSRSRGFDPTWAEAFLHSMELDLKKRVYETLDDLLVYIHGSAEVIGLMMAAIMELPPASHHHATRLGRAMQTINFIRDIQEDGEMGRVYFPQDELDVAGLRDLSRAEAFGHRERFENFVRRQIVRYREWQTEAETGFGYIPFRCRVPVKTASDMYRWTADRIERCPMIVYRRQVKPPKWRILATGIRNLATAWHTRPLPGDSEEK